MAEASISGIEFKIVGTTGKAKTSIDKLINSLHDLRSALQTSSTGKLKNDLDGIDKSAKKSTTTIGKLFKSIGRIGFYRAIRSALRFVTEGFREGLQNAYQFSKIVGYELAGTMDTLATKSLTMKNQLGAAFGGLIMAIQPILLQIIALVTRAANAIAQLMAIIGGKSTYLKAIDTMTEYGAAVGGAGQAAKEAMKYLAPFDELNVLPSDSGGGGGGGASVPDYSAMFEETPVSQALQDFVTDFKITVSDVLFDWSDLTGEQIAEKVLAGLFMLTGAGVGFILGGVPGALVGSVIGLTLGLIADTFIFDHDGVLEPSEIAHGLKYVLNALAGGVIGFLIGGPGGALIGAGIGLGVSLIADALDFKAGAENKVSNWLDNLTAAMTTIAGAVIGFMIGGPAGALIGASIGLGINLILEALKPKAEREGSGFLNDLTSAMETMVGGAIGFFVGGPAGALLGMSITVGLHLLLKGSISEWIKEKFIDPLVNAYNNFVEEHPKVAQFFGLEQIDLSTGPSGHSSSSVSISGISVEVTEVKDSIPTEKKTLKDFWADIKDKYNNIKDKVLGGFNADVTTQTDKVPKNNKILRDEEAVFGSVSDKELTAGQKIINGIKGIFSGTDDTKLTLAQKAINGIKAIFGNADPSKLSTSDKTIPATAKFTSKTYAFTGNMVTPGGNPIFNSQAKFTSKQYAFGGSMVTSGGNPIFNSQAKFTSKQYAFGGNMVTSSGNPIFNSQAKFTSRNDALTDGQKTFGSTAKFSKWSNSFDKKDLPWAYSTAWFDSWGNSIPGDNSPWLSTLAWLDSWGKGLAYGDNPWLSAKAWFDSWSNGLTSKPEIAAVAKIGQGDVVFDWQPRAEGGVFYGGAWHDIPQYAGGTSRAHGSVFIAGEAGPEVVGHIGGRTEVLNRSQLAATMYAAVSSAMAGLRFNVSGMNAATASADSGYDEETLYRAMLRALNDSDVFPDEIDLDGDAVYRKMVQRNRLNTRMTGVNAMATA